MPRELHPENLVPFTQRSKEEVRLLNRKGGIKSGESRRIRSSLIRFLSLPLSNEDDKATKEKLGLKVKSKLKQHDAVSVKLLEKARKGDMKAIRLLSEITGDLSKQVQMDITTGGSPLDVFSGMSNRQLENIVTQLSDDIGTRTTDD